MQLNKAKLIFYVFPQDSVFAKQYELYEELIVLSSLLSKYLCVTFLCTWKSNGWLLNL